ncbi:MAG TPA: RidA family protein [Bacteroidales bacterium]|nr:RidA family protein [Bacteroidales bacterium]
MKKIIYTPNAPKAIGPYSQAVEMNGFLFISGQIPLDPATGKLVEGGIAEQTDRVMRNIGEILQAAGYDFKNVVKYTCLLRDMDHYAAMNAVYSKYYPENPPARATFATAGLPMNALLEVETIAAK